MSNNLFKRIDQNKRVLRFDEAQPQKIHPGTGEPIKEGDYMFMVCDDHMAKMIKDNLYREFEFVKRMTPTAVKVEKEEDVQVTIIEPNFEKAIQEPVKESGLKSIDEIKTMTSKQLTAYCVEHGIDESGNMNKRMVRIEEAKAHL